MGTTANAGLPGKWRLKRCYVSSTKAVTALPSVAEMQSFHRLALRRVSAVHQSMLRTTISYTFIWRKATESVCSISLIMLASSIVVTGKDNALVWCLSVRLFVSSAMNDHPYIGG